MSETSFGELPELFALLAERLIERQLGRGAVEEVLRGMAALGYRLVPPEAGSSGDIGQTIEAILQGLESRPAQLDALLDIHKQPEFDPCWRQDIRLYHAFGRALVLADQPAHALELIHEGLAIHKDNPDLLYLRVWAYVRGGDLAQAEEYLEGLRQPGPDGKPRVDALPEKLRVDALSLAGKVPKERYLRSNNPARKAQLAVESARGYEEAYCQTNDPFPGINAAAMWLMAGDQGKSRQYAGESLTLANGRIARPNLSAEDLYWLHCTIGDAHLLLSDIPRARYHYDTAAGLARAHLSNRAVMLRQVRMIAEKMPVAEALLPVFDVGPVLFFVGHMIDLPPNLTGRTAFRFPPGPELEQRVRQEIRKRLDVLKPSVGYCSGASGSDLIFAEEVDRSAELHLVLPFDLEDFHATSVDFGLEQMKDYRRRFKAVFEAVEARKHIHYGTEEKYLGDDSLFQFVSDFGQGLALTHAARLGVEPHLLALHDPAAPRRHGGTVFFLEDWRARGPEATVVDLAELRSRVPSNLPDWWKDVAPGAAAVFSPALHRRAVKVMLFSDVKNYSQLRDAQVPAFFKNFLEALADVIGDPNNCPQSCNTWGDGLFLVFNQACDAAHFSLALLERLAKIDFQKVGLPSDTTLRIGVHAGPVFPHWDQVIGRQNFFGTQVNRAARIEPATTPGCVYASEQFAALLALETGHNFDCVYVKTAKLGKLHDAFRCPLYRVIRKEP